MKSGLDSPTSNAVVVANFDLDLCVKHAALLDRQRAGT